MSNFSEHPPVPPPPPTELPQSSSVDLGPNSRQVDALGRQTWNKAYYVARALARQYEGGADVGVDFLADTKSNKAYPPAKERRNLQQREKEVELEADLGKMKVITAATPREQQGGFWCKVCSCLMKDSQTFLDHINGKKHNRMLGMTMRVEKVDASTIRNKIQKIRVQHAKEVVAQSIGGVEDIELRLADAKEQHRLKKEKRKEKKRQRKQREAEQNAELETEVNPFVLMDQMAQMAAELEAEAQTSQPPEVKSEPETSKMLPTESFLPPKVERDEVKQEFLSPTERADLPADSLAQVGGETSQEGPRKRRMFTRFDQVAAE